MVTPPYQQKGVLQVEVAAVVVADVGVVGGVLLPYNTPRSITSAKEIDW